MRKEALRNILAAVGLVVICVVALAIFISIFTGGGVTGDNTNGQHLPTKERKEKNEHFQSARA